MTDRLDTLARETAEPMLRFEKRSIDGIDLLYVLGSITCMITLGLATYGLLSQGSYASILTGLLMIGFAIFFRDLFIDGIRKQHAATFILYPDRAVMEFKRRPSRTIDLNASIEVDIRYDDQEKVFSVEKVSSYIFLKDKERLLEVDREWGWRQEDLVRMWDPFLVVIERNGLRLSRELSIIREMGGLVAYDEF